MINASRTAGGYRLEVAGPDLTASGRARAGHRGQPTSEYPTGWPVKSIASSAANSAAALQAVGWAMVGKIWLAFRSLERCNSLVWLPQGRQTLQKQCLPFAARVIPCFVIDGGKGLLACGSADEGTHAQQITAPGAAQRCRCVCML